MWSYLQHLAFTREKKYANRPREAHRFVKQVQKQSDENKLSSVIDIKAHPVRPIPVLSLKLQEEDHQTQLRASLTYDLQLALHQQFKIDLAGLRQDRMTALNHADRARIDNFILVLQGIPQAVPPVRQTLVFVSTRNDEHLVSKHEHYMEKTKDKSDLWLADVKALCEDGVLQPCNHILDDPDLGSRDKALAFWTFLNAQRTTPNPTVISLITMDFTRLPEVSNFEDCKLLLHYITVLNGELLSFGPTYGLSDSVLISYALAKMQHAKFDTFRQTISLQSCQPVISMTALGAIVTPPASLLSWLQFTTVFNLLRESETSRKSIAFIDESSSSTMAMAAQQDSSVSDRLVIANLQRQLVEAQSRQSRPTAQSDRFPTPGSSPSNDRGRDYRNKRTFDNRSASRSPTRTPEYAAAMDAWYANKPKSPAQTGMPKK